MASRPCAKAAAWPTPPSSSAWAERTARSPRWRHDSGPRGHRRSIVPSREHAPEDPFVAADHRLGGEAQADVGTASVGGDLVHPADGLDHVVERGAEEPGP